MPKKTKGRVLNASTIAFTAFSKRCFSEASVLSRRSCSAFAFLTCSTSLFANSALYSFSLSFQYCICWSAFALSCSYWVNWILYVSMASLARCALASPDVSMLPWKLFNTFPRWSLAFSKTSSLIRPRTAFDKSVLLAMLEILSPPKKK